MAILNIEKKQDPPFDQAMKDYLKQSKAVNQPSTYDRKELSASYLQAHYGTKPISSIEGNQVLIQRCTKDRKDQIKTKQMEAGRSEDEVTYTSINRELALLRRMFNVLIKDGKATRNPVSRGNPKRAGADHRGRGEDHQGD